LETGVIIGGVLSVAGLVLASPVALGFDGTGPFFLVAAYPLLLDLALAAIVLAQIGLGVRPFSRFGLLPVAGLASLGMGDLGTLLSYADGTYNSAAIFVVPYGVAFALIVTAAARRSVPHVWDARGSTVSLQLVAAAFAIAALVLSPANTGQWYVTVPAVLTLVAAGLRLVLALEESRAAGEARRLSLTDDLTGLPTRGAALTDLEEVVDQGKPMGLVLLDIDSFKEVNDSLGHAAGDALLQHVSTQLGRIMRGRGRVFRMGGDEFAVLLLRADETYLLDLANTVREELLDPVTVQGIDIGLRATAGVAVGTGEDTRGGDVLRRAEVALHEAKSARSGALVYDPARDEFNADRLRLINELRLAIDQGQLRPWYQPQIDARTRRVVGVEALIRWHHPERGVLAPIHFLDDARRVGLMASLTDRVMHDVVNQARKWWAQGVPLRVSFNCAPPELLGATLLPRLYRAVERAGMPPSQMLVEVTEDSFVSSPEFARETLSTLRGQGIEVAIDDYGTGFSSLAYLRDLPVNELKIDRAFVKDLLRDPKNQVIVESTCRLAHAMDLRVVAEGVEDDLTAARLTTMGVDILQGYFAAAALPAAQVTTWVRTWEAAATVPSARSAANG
jgi:diguanylate cyclase (GGDEF)-like protein